MIIGLVESVSSFLMSTPKNCSLLRSYFIIMGQWVTGRDDPSDILLLLFGTVYLPSAETVLDLLLRHSENISKLICSKQPL